MACALNLHILYVCCFEVVPFFATTYWTDFTFVVDCFTAHPIDTSKVTINSRNRTFRTLQTLIITARLGLGKVRLQQ